MTKLQVLFSTFASQICSNPVWEGRGEFSETCIKQMQVEGSNKPIRGVPLHVVALYWCGQAELGNPEARVLVRAMAVESLTQVADRAFGATKTPQEQEELLPLSCSPDSARPQAVIRACNLHSLN